MLGGQCPIWQVTTDAYDARLTSCCAMTCLHQVCVPVAHHPADEKLPQALLGAPKKLSLEQWASTCSFLHSVACFCRSQALGSIEPLYASMSMSIWTFVRETPESTYLYLPPGKVGSVPDRRVQRASALTGKFNYSAGEE